MLAPSIFAVETVLTMGMMSSQPTRWYAVICFELDLKNSDVQKLFEVRALQRYNCTCLRFRNDKSTYCIFQALTFDFWNVVYYQIREVWELRPAKILVAKMRIFYRSHRSPSTDGFER